ncbi:MAG: c-type cytochrome [Rhodocyclales bacterium]|nr:c-type cytochrome [Rhodocyclales bacterium]
MKALMIRGNRPRRLSILAIVLPSIMCFQSAMAETRTDRSGKQVVETVCVGCHESGKDGAPRIGDQAEWAKRASHGLGAVTEHAITGIRKMPAHGAYASLSDLEMSRGVAYMVSGGAAIDPSKPYSSPSQMTGAQLVKARCSECHGSGKEGAPRIGNMDDWKPRLQVGVDNLVTSAIRGHNAMPARAGMANLSDSDLRSAVIFMVVPQKP